MTIRVAKKNKKISVLMVTGVYFPEINGAVLQCMRVISFLSDKVNFNVLSSSKNNNRLKISTIESIDVYRLSSKSNFIIRLAQLFNIIFFFVRNKNKFDIVHFHGFTSRNAFIILISKIFRKKIIIKFTSFGHDDPGTIKRKSRILYFIYQFADSYIGISPVFKESYTKLNFNENNFFSIPNGVDIKLFSPLKNNTEKTLIRSKLGLPEKINLIIFVGHFSLEKSALDLLYAWINLQEKGFALNSGIVFIGSTDTDEFEVNNETINLIRSLSRNYLNKKLFFVEKTNNIEEYYKASDVYVMSSVREGLPNTLLEAMSSSLPAIATKLDGITDWIINDGEDGLLYEIGNINQLSSHLKKLLLDFKLREKLGCNARQTIESRFNLLITSQEIFKVYEGLYEN